MRHDHFRIGTALALAGLLAASLAAQTSAPAERTRGYLDHAGLTTRLQELARQAGPRGALVSLGKTSAGRDTWLLSVSGQGPLPPEKRQALLLIGGISGDDPTGSAVCLGVAERLVKALAAGQDDPLSELLARHVVHVVPRLNADALERFFAPVWHDSPLNARPVDDDRDGTVNEDGPNDLDGDGLISVMRVKDPRGTWMIDPDTPRLMRKAEADKGEEGVYRLLLEGEDSDADGEINEDGPGGVDDDRNWPHLFESGHANCGIHAMSEPETRALAEFVVAHKEITLAICYGRHDNLVKVPKGKERGPHDRAYRDLHPDDVALYEHISAEYKDRTGLGGSNGATAAGALYSWLYAQRAITTFAVRPFWPLDRKPAEDDEGEEKETKEEEAKPKAEGKAPAAAGGRPSRPGPGAPSRRPGGGGDSDDDKDPLAVRISTASKKWLEYSDEQRDGVGFVDWHDHTHPTLGPVELGGFAPFFMSTAPPEELPGLCDAQLDFLVYVAGLLPRVELAEAEVVKLGADVWRIEAVVVNRGYLPTHSGIARHSRQPALVVRPMVAAERIVGGDRLGRISNLPGSGGAAELSWLVRGKAGDRITLRMVHYALGTQEVEVTLEESNGEGD